MRETGGRYAREQLAEAVTGASTWAGVLRALGLPVSGGRRRAVQRAVAAYGLDTSHFVRRSPWTKYSDEQIRRAVASATTLREVATVLGAAPSTGTLSHIRRRVAAARLDVRHFPGLHRSGPELPFSAAELRQAAASAESLRALARALGIPDDGRSRGALRRMLRDAGADVSHFSHARVAIPEGDLREAMARSVSYAGVLRELGLPVTEPNRAKVQRRARRLGVEDGHFRRPVKGAASRSASSGAGGGARGVLTVRPDGLPRVRHERLRRALDETGMAYACAGCGNPGSWEGQPMTLQIDHINGDWRDNRRENLRYLCPNCHAVTATWCGRNRRREAARTGPVRQ
ncbi:HNH endonuclease [Streptomyces nanshensis]|uniref:HNH endonuclease n=1 Tax=Streptomyces nanshensis TaxID=518642 RepID=A0A1E7LCG8_9ACTN|nr:HNH endonuclease [Streptomyces nanshensis]OEV13858.1 HNH endonuclease [Streptomyces nanshensis]